jgi:spermidine/putrescine transport system substrate-binding protein
MINHKKHKRLCLGTVFLLILSILLASCASRQEHLAEELTIYNWEGDFPQSILDAFTAEFGVKINYVAYESQEEAIENIRAGEVYDVVVMESRFLPLLISNGLLAELDYTNILNFKNISPNFRDLTYDPENRYSIPYSWGTTGLMIRTDLVEAPVTRWGDLWDKRYEGRAAIWIGQPREVLAITLKSLGYSANSENPVELEKALARLIALKHHLRTLEDYDLETCAPALASGEIVIAVGYSGDYHISMDMGLAVEYIMPEEGALLWGDNFIIPANSPNKYTAELFVNFLLRPEISAEIVNQKYYASANDAARAFVNAEILNDPSIYPSSSVLQNAEIILPLGAQGQELYDEIWERFLNAPPR